LSNTAAYRYSPGEYGGGGNARRHHGQRHVEKPPHGPGPVDLRGVLHLLAVVEGEGCDQPEAEGQGVDLVGNRKAQQVVEEV
jgi:hypothetical protein